MQAGKQVGMQAGRQAGRHDERVKRLASLAIITDSDVGLISVNIFLLGVFYRSCVVCTMHLVKVICHLT